MVNQAQSNSSVPPRAPVRSRLGAERDEWHTINACRRELGQGEPEVRHMPHRRHGGQPDRAEDRSPRTDAPGPRVFRSEIRNAPFP